MDEVAEKAAMRCHLVLGGARSGKSRYALALAEASGLACVFVATAQARDAEMSARIARHVAERDARWKTLEVDHDLRGALRDGIAPGSVAVVDCLTLWLSNLLLRGHDLEAASSALADQARTLPYPAIFVSNEVGCGIVPDNAMARQFRDAQGRLNGIMAAACRSVVLVTAGLPLQLKPQTMPPMAL